MTNAETIKAIDAEIKIQEAEMKLLREKLAAITTQEENQVERLFDAVLNCPHSITHESVTLHFYPRQKEGHNALSQLRHRLADYDLAARQRELQLLGEIEALERLALNVLKQLGAEVTPNAPLYDPREVAFSAQAAPPAHADARDAARYRWLRNQMLGVDFYWGENRITALCFEMPEDGCAYGGDCDQNIDAAIAAQAKQGE